MNAKFIMAIDQGTSSTRAVIYNSDTRIVGKAQQEFRQIYPEPGWVEHNPEEIWTTTQNVIQRALKEVGINPGQIAGIGITNQRETTIIWDRSTGKPVYNAIVWQCRRTAEICNRLREKGLENEFRARTGLLLDPYFSGTKIKWILDNVSGAKERARKGELCFGTIDSWLIWKLTGGKTHITDYTNASRTLLYNIHELKWDSELMEYLEIPEAILPEVRSCSEIYGVTSSEAFSGDEVPIAGIAGDQQSATFAQGCYEKGMTKITYGTGGFLLMNTGSKAIRSENGLLTTIAWGLDKEVTYALEGSIFNAGTAIQWLKDNLRLIDDPADSEYFAGKVESTEGVYMVPAFTGLGAPYWNPEARAMIVGLTRGSNANHIIRATLESLAYQSQDVLKAMTGDSGMDLKEIKVDGGVSRNDFMLQFLADLTETVVERPGNIEVTVNGAAYLAGLAVGFWQNREEILNKRGVDRTFTPAIDRKKYGPLYKGWKNAVETNLYWCKNLS